MDGGKILAVAVLLVLGAGVYAIPKAYIEGYAVWVRRKHGMSVNMNVGLLLMTLAPCLMLALLAPGQYPTLELVAGTAAAAAVITIAWDNYCFWRKDYRYRK